MKRLYREDKPKFYTIVMAFWVEHLEPGDVRQHGGVRLPVHRNV